MKTDGAKRISAYLDVVHEIVQKKNGRNKTAALFFKTTTSKNILELLPEDSMLKQKYNTLLKMKAGDERNDLEKDLTLNMKPGSIDVNIMVNVDRIHFNKIGDPLGEEFTDAKSRASRLCQQLSSVFDCIFSRH